MARYMRIRHHSGSFMSHAVEFLNIETAGTDREIDPIIRLAVSDEKFGEQVIE